MAKFKLNGTTFEEIGNGVPMVTLLTENQTLLSKKFHPRFINKSIRVVHVDEGRKISQ